MHYKATIQDKQHYSKNTKSYVWLKREKKIKLKLKHHKWTPLHSVSDPNKRYIKQKKDPGIERNTNLQQQQQNSSLQCKKKTSGRLRIWGTTPVAAPKPNWKTKKKEIWEQRRRKPNRKTQHKKNIQVMKKYVRWGDDIFIPNPFRL